MAEVCSRCKHPANQPLIPALFFDAICPTCANLLSTKQINTLWTSIRPRTITSFEEKRGLVRRKIKRFRKSGRQSNLLYPEFEGPIIHEDVTENAAEEEEALEPETLRSRGNELEYLGTPSLSLEGVEPDPEMSTFNDHTNTAAGSSDPNQLLSRTHRRV